MVADNGVAVFDDLPDQRSSLHGHVYDLDCVSTYPTTGEVMNISRETTFRELTSMEGIDEEVQRRAGINLTGGKMNALEICTDTMFFPDLHDLLDEFKKEKGIT